ncbi:hypothetical protein LTR78_004848 [Recurvomyces mirabilis]|uniref:Gfo/Idh/MocA-like oxidoreductase N-terminal domain-containing protein n=1 Tax=Recurvomyces mirabilis TaxID=574656 RepID=A0AAE0WP98_9PEZI|nr:hypothetical protein LTR78_004848 [Recurvomyces mirabilis]
MFGMRPTEATVSGRVINVGIVGCGLVTQVVHIPCLNSLSHQFQITYFSDVSEEAVKCSQLKVAGNLRPKTTRSVEELCNAPSVDLVLVASHHTFHAAHAELALRAKKHVFIEKPIALSLQDADRIIAADKAAGGGRAFIGFMRRYAAAFVDAVREVGTIESIHYVRVRDIIGPNSVFVGQSGTCPRTFNDYREEDSNALREKTSDDMKQALQHELGIAVTKETTMMWDVLSFLGAHDLSAMREIVGMPDGVVGFSPCATTGSPFGSAIFRYSNFAVAYESGVDQVARFDASIEVFGDSKTVKVCIDTPFIRGLPTTMVVKETLPDDSYKESVTRSTYEDPFMLEWKEVYRWIVEGKVPKTTPQDARCDLEILGMLMKSAFT